MCEFTVCKNVRNKHLYLVWFFFNLLSMYVPFNIFLTKEKLEKVAAVQYERLL